MVYVKSDISFLNLSAQKNSGMLIFKSHMYFIHIQTNHRNINYNFLYLFQNNVYLFLIHMFLFFPLIFLYLIQISSLMTKLGIKNLLIDIN